MKDCVVVLSTHRLKLGSMVEEKNGAHVGCVFFFFEAMQGLTAVEEGLTADASSSLEDNVEKKVGG